uniref:Uncharacterized protein n=1 Tax=Arundo donax TaxID=35708 RepID=A0A0A9ALP3_ARUDO
MHRRKIVENKKAKTTDYISQFKDHPVHMFIENNQSCNKGITCLYQLPSDI